MRSLSRSWVAVVLAFLIIVGFGFRASQLGAEGLSEDELNKLHAVEDYRAHGLTAANGEHPMLMKAILTASIIAGEHWNSSALVSAHPSLRVSTEAALRLPAALFGAFISLLIFLLASELFGIEIGLVAAALWAFDPTGISFNRIAKEDTFLLFFFLLANIFWVRSQRIAESGRGRPEPYYWATAAAYGAMMASKYMPVPFAVSVSYYYIFQGIKQTRWRMGKTRWLMFFGLMGAVFLLCNPTILLPGTWHEMRIFASENRIGHDSYEFMGALYRNQMTLWLKGVPWYFYYLFMATKLPVAVLVGFLAGLPLLFRKRLGDGRFLLLFWLMYFFLPFTFIGGKYTRYFTWALPVVLITAAIGFQALGQLCARLISAQFEDKIASAYVRAVLAILAVTLSLVATVSAAPHFRLYMNRLGGGAVRAGSNFPHDEFYDGSMRETMAQVARLAPRGARVVSESPALATYYAQAAGRDDLIALSLSDREALKQLAERDIVIIARGRRYFSNDAVTERLETSLQPVATIPLGAVPASRIYVLDRAAISSISDLVR